MDSDRNTEKSNERKIQKKGLRWEIPKDLILRAIEEVSKGSKIKTTADKYKYKPLWVITNLW